MAPVEEEIVENGVMEEVVRHTIIEDNEKIWVDHLLGVLTKVIDKLLLLSDNVVKYARRVTIKDIV